MASKPKDETGYFKKRRDEIENRFHKAGGVIFVFGSNLAGRHGKGSALEAYRNWGAQYGFGHGRTGNAYAIPTKNKFMQTIPLATIGNFIAMFLDYARENREFRFEIVDIGCGLAGYKPEEIRPFFAGAPSNCIFLGELGKQP